MKYKYFLFFTFIIFFKILADEAKDSFVLENTLFFESHFGKEVGVEKDYSTLGEIIFLDKQGISPFFDLRWHRFSTGSNAANVGIGFRKTETKYCYWTGLYYDWRHLRHADFQQLGAGFGFRSCSWILSANCAFPFPKRKIVASETCNYSDGFCSKFKKTAFSCNYASLDLDYELPNCFDCLRTTFGVGGYYFSNKKSKHKLGGTINFEAEMGGLYAEALYSRDDVFHDRFQFTLGFSFSFRDLKDCCDLLFMERDRCLPKRKRVIVIEERQKYWNNWD